MYDNLKLSDIEKGLPQLARQLSYQLVIGNLDKTPSEYLLELGYSKEEIECAIKLNASYYQKLKRIRNRLKNLEKIYFENPKEYNLLFLTFTFTDPILERNKPKSLRVQVARFLKEYTIDYFANCDYGSLNGRLHYHSVVVVKGKLNYKIWQKQFGALNGKRVNITEDAPKRMAKYMHKLALHSIKESTKYQGLIYSRKKKE